MNPLADLPLWAALAAFLAAATVITVAGIGMAETADRLADRTGIGEALFGGVLLGGSTSIPGIVASTTAAAQGHAELAFSNAVGGIAAQTFFLAIADAVYRRANLEHAALVAGIQIRATIIQATRTGLYTPHRCQTPKTRVAEYLYALHLRLTQVTEVFLCVQQTKRA